ncbi:SGNH/GDSL hydrolase family protein [Tardiphaga sp.]|uniref:SGNH/GDSL hydrolase family protein n=1 Tax=Tardiphaga sp. TaxID=1926292 RepID=UPI0026202911|nr:SGNH/GDSL hydrolase family protein [Tardiphaga sp.]MDB5618477.1 hypothetical protein [Tardiphaga sp.]
MSEGIRAPNVPAGSVLTEFLGLEQVGSTKSLRRFTRGQVLGPIDYGGTSTTSMAISLMPQTFTTQPALGYRAGGRGRLISAANPANFMEGPITAYDIATGVMTISFDNKGPSSSGTHADWVLTVAGEKGAGDLSSFLNLGDLSDKDAALNNLAGVSSRVSQSLDLNALFRVAANIRAGVVNHRPLLPLLPKYGIALLNYLKSVGTGSGGFNILVISDSTGAGVGANGNANAADYSWPSVMREDLINKLYLAHPDTLIGTNGWDSALTTADTRVVQWGGYQTSTLKSLGGSMWAAYAAGAPFKFRPKRIGNFYFRVYYATDPSFGSFKIDVNGGAPTTVTPTAAASVAFADIAGSGGGPYTLNITPLSGHTEILGVWALDSSSGPFVTIWNGSINGGKIADFVGATYPWSPLNAIGTVIQPALTIIMTGINDGGTNGTSDAADMQTVIDKCKLTGDVVIVGNFPYVVSPTTTAYTQAYRQQLHAAIAAKNGIPFISAEDYFINHAAMVAAGMSFDDFHPNEIAYSIFGKVTGGFIA